MATIPVSFDTLKEHHPSYREIRALIGGPLLRSVRAGNWETCCIQISYALNHSGAVIENYASYDNTAMGRKVRALKSNDDRYYIFEVTDMKTYLNGRYGVAENHRGKKKGMIDAIRGRTGIIAFGHRHVDLWEGERFHWQQLYIDLWLHESTTKRGVFFWQVGAPVT